MIDNQGERFKNYLKKLVKSKTVKFGNDFINMETAAKMLGYSKQNLYYLFKQDQLSKESVEKILKTFKTTEEDLWGDSFSKEQLKTFESILNKANRNSILDNYEFTGDKFIGTPEQPGKSKKQSVKPKEEITPLPYDDYMMVEYVDLSASAGTLGGSNVDLLPDTKKRLVPREFDKGNYLVVRVNGDSMTDGTDISIPDGVEILVKEHVLENGDKLPIRGNLFVICSREGNVFKQIVEHNTDLGYIRCHSYNPKYEDYNIPMSEVFQIFIYRKIVGYRPNIPEIR